MYSAIRGDARACCKPWPLNPLAKAGSARRAPVPQKRSGRNVVVVVTDPAEPCAPLDAGTRARAGQRCARTAHGRLRNLPATLRIRLLRDSAQESIAFRPEPQTRRIITSGILRGDRAGKRRRRCGSREHGTSRPKLAASSRDRVRGASPFSQPSRPSVAACQRRCCDHATARSRPTRSRR